MLTDEDFQTIECPICKVNEENLLFVGKDLLVGVEGKFRVIQCNKCGLIYINPQPSTEMLYKYYPSGYPGSSFATLYRISAQKTLIDKVLNLLYLRRFKTKIKAIEKYHALNSNTTVLDIGCGNGGFLYSLEQIKKIKGEGVEISQEAVNFALNTLKLKVKGGTFSAVGFDKESFDVITLFEYFEHDTAPIHTLNKIKDLLKEDGLLVLELPNIASPTFRIFGKYWVNLDIPRHVFQYSPKTLSRLLRANGFKPVGINFHPTASIITSLYHLLGITQKAENINKLPLLMIIPLYHLPIMLIESFFGIFLRVFRSGDIMTIYARKQ